MNEFMERREGVAHFGTGKFHFAPNETAVGSIEAVSGVYKLNLLSDGSCEAVEVPKRVRHYAKLLRKVSHGRLSYTHDNTYLLTIRISVDENLDVPEVIMREAHEAAMALEG